MTALRIQRVGWACYIVTSENGTKVVVDPYLHGSGDGHSGLPGSPFNVDDLADTDVVAVTHAGFDHRAQAIDVTLAGSAILLCGTALYGVALEAGVPAERCAGVVSGVTFRHADVTIKALDARHTSNMTSHGQFIADEPLSFMITTEAGSRVFCGGDFSISADLRVWGELFAPRVGILGIGGVQVGPVDTTLLPPADAAIAAEWLGVAHVIPVHYPPGGAAPDELRRELANRESPVEVVTLEFGDTWTQSVDPPEGSAI
jgi:L-ascorbate metabolism protein UlaG (beta-lactamase superfamily)